MFPDLDCLSPLSEPLVGLGAQDFDSRNVYLMPLGQGMLRDSSELSHAYDRILSPEQEIVDHVMSTTR